MDKYIVKMKFQKDTKNTTRYEEVTEPGKPSIIGTLYVQKWAAGGAQNITVTIEEKK